jgi:hypothetical protein
MPKGRLVAAARRRENHTERRNSPMKLKTKIKAGIIVVW